MLTLAAQLLGHSLLNRVVASLGPSVTSTAILLEPRAPPSSRRSGSASSPRPAYPALLVILAGLALLSG